MYPPHTHTLYPCVLVPEISFNIAWLTYLMRLRVSLYMVKAAFSVQLSCSIAFPVSRKYSAASRYIIPCAMWSVSLSAICFSLLASVRYWFCWFGSLYTKGKCQVHFQCRCTRNSPPDMCHTATPCVYTVFTHVMFALLFSLIFSAKTGGAVIMQEIFGR